MIDLAPNHKLGLTVANPILLAGGSIGYGEAIHKGLDIAHLGAVVIGPILLSSRIGSTAPRLASTNGGFVLETGLQNRGITAVLKQFAKLWPRLGCPVIAQVADSQPAPLAKVAAQLTSDQQLSGLELLLPRNANAELTRALLRVVIQHSDLPIWAKVPLDRAAVLAPHAVEAGAVGLVIGQPLLGAALHKVPAQQGAPDEEVNPMVIGSLFGPLAFAPMLAALIAVAKLALPCALIACGGVHTLAQAQQALHAGAHALQVDSAIWVEPSLPGRLVDELGFYTTASAKS
jgi:dihydroorotate dehydrogenase (NAD+) catalytic subunit